MSQETLYFAYGSNINLRQMAVRCPDAQVVESAVLENYELLFRGNDRDYGVATIRPKEGCQVHGLLWKITPECERSLDLYEGYPHLYEKQKISLTTKSGQQISAMVYVMTREKEREPSMHTRGYFSGMMEGFQQNGLPVKSLEKAISKLAREQVRMERPKQKRRENNQHER